jgi:hypothetical protein
MLNNIKFININLKTIFHIQVILLGDDVIS